MPRRPDIFRLYELNSARCRVLSRLYLIEAEILRCEGGYTAATDQAGDAAGSGGSSGTRRKTGRARKRPSSPARPRAVSRGAGADPGDLRGGPRPALADRGSRGDRDEGAGNLDRPAGSLKKDPPETPPQAAGVQAAGFLVQRSAVEGPSTPPLLRDEVAEPAGYRRSRFGASTAEDAEPINASRLAVADPPAPPPLRAYGIDSAEPVAEDLAAPVVDREPPAFHDCHYKLPAACRPAAPRGGIRSRVYDASSGNLIGQSVSEAARVLGCSAQGLAGALDRPGGGGAIRGIPVTRTKPVIEEAADAS